MRGAPTPGRGDEVPGNEHQGDGPVDDLQCDEKGQCSQVCGLLGGGDRDASDPRQGDGEALGSLYPAAECSACVVGARVLVLVFGEGVVECAACQAVSDP